ncbi:hypothetical protein BCY86_05735 [Pajaroellobacter abortibovis]|uniref:Uncharacterized protein n=1 Tax=Pajaroellobacter abortibovis TaxID=1882918 RepID=A0A1L6MXV9_9BACT|nr:hypothetical protein BCY86_05735 [Pajaroellobacter abortibovis]
MLRGRNDHVELKPKYEMLVEYAKHCSWIVEENHYEVHPLTDKVIYRKGAHLVTRKQMPEQV